MDNIISIGAFAREFAQGFAQYEQYSVKTVGVGKGYDFAVQKQGKPEDYDGFIPKNWPPSLTGDVLLLVSTEDVSLITLGLLQSLQKLQVSLLYIVPDQAFLSPPERLLSNALFGVLQEFARSGKLKNIWLVSQEGLDQFVGDLPIKQIKEATLNFIISSVNFFNISANVEPIYSIQEVIPAGARIATFGYVDLNTGEERLAFPIQLPSTIVYKLFVSKERLETERDLLKKVKTFVKEKQRVVGDNRVFYKIYETTGQETCLCEVYSAAIQDR